MVLGFGKGEDITAIALINNCYYAIQARPNDAANAVDDVEEHYLNLAAKYKEMDKSVAPIRYSYFYSNFEDIYDGKYIVEFTFHHISRRHPMSADGWAMVKSEWILSDDNTYGKSIFKRME